MFKEDANNIPSRFKKIDEYLNVKFSLEFETTFEYDSLINMVSNLEKDIFNEAKNEAYNYLYINRVDEYKILDMTGSVEE